MARIGAPGAALARASSARQMTAVPLRRAASLAAGADTLLTAYSSRNQALPLSKERIHQAFCSLQTVILPTSGGLESLNCFW